MFVDPIAARQILVKDSRKFEPGDGNPVVSGGAFEAERTMMVFAK